ncbi:hypothetical protein O181_004571 [Austropuccinia psidii MF-1]|uniref:Uncharacterized protein n=1 Tax=Austropuccinia psidii MF-1 TaxID=1389203 RepID=A0A9Q3BH60_9BASI|nr:hypothetical protein [Austropuccinia psidii MF-1]
MLLVHKEKVPGHHHPYASKPRTALASLSRETFLDAEDKNMSPNHSETNHEPRRDNFMVHEVIRKQRNQACKDHNVAKLAFQKEKQRWLKAELPESLHGIRSAVHTHCLLVLKVRDTDFSSIPAPPRTEEHEIEIQADGKLEYVTKDVSNKPSTQVQSWGFQSYCENELHKLGLKQLNWDWEISWQHPSN